MAPLATRSRSPRICRLSRPIVLGAAASGLYLACAAASAAPSPESGRKPAPPAPVSSDAGNSAEDTGNSTPVFVRPISAEELAQAPGSPSEKAAQAEATDAQKNTPAYVVAVVQIAHFAGQLLALVAAAGLFGALVAGITALLRRRKRPAFGE